MTLENDLKQAEDALFRANVARDPNRGALLKAVLKLREQFAREVNRGGRDDGTGERPPRTKGGALAAPLTVGPAPGERCLSLRQPFAHLILMGIKTVENRRWPTKYRGRLWIHAAKTLDVKSWSDVFDGDDFAELPALSALPLGAVIGAAEVWDCVELGDVPDGADPGGFASGEWCWLLRDPRPLATPFPCKGALSLWTPPAGIVLP
jgi:hypothetical protein